MDQIKIGKFIAKKRKQNNLTQLDLAKKLGVSEKSISNWENGRNMPDLSLFNPLCTELGISINELMSGEELIKEDYQKKFEENIINVVVEKNKVNRKRKKIIAILLLLLSLVIFIALIIYNTVELDIKYDGRLMKCHFENNKLVYQIKGISVLNTSYYERNIDDKKYIVFHSTINLYNKRHSNWEYRESLAYSLNNQNVPYGFASNFDAEEEYDKVLVFYTNNSLKKIEKLDNIDFRKELARSYKMCELIDRKEF